MSWMKGLNTIMQDRINHLELLKENYDDCDDNIDEEIEALEKCLNITIDLED